MHMKLSVVSLATAAVLALSGCSATRLIDRTLPEPAPSATATQSPTPMPTPTPTSGDPIAERLAAIAEASGASSVHRVTVMSRGMFVELWAGSEAQVWYASAGIAPKRKPELEDPVLPPGKGLPAADFPLADLALVRDAAGDRCPDLTLMVATSLAPSGIPLTFADCKEGSPERLAAAIDGRLNTRPADFYAADYLRLQLEMARKYSPDGRIWNI